MFKLLKKEERKKERKKERKIRKKKKERKKERKKEGKNDIVYFFYLLSHRHPHCVAEALSEGSFGDQVFWRAPRAAGEI